MYGYFCVMILHSLNRHDGLFCEFVENFLIQDLARVLPSYPQLLPILSYGQC